MLNFHQLTTIHKILRDHTNNSNCGVYKEYYSHIRKGKKLKKKKASIYNALSGFIKDIIHIYNIYVTSITDL